MNVAVNGGAGTIVGIVAAGLAGVILPANAGGVVD